jgi:hypothetical protein
VCPSVEAHPLVPEVYLNINEIIRWTYGTPHNKRFINKTKPDFSVKPQKTSQKNCDKNRNRTESIQTLVVSAIAAK